MAVVVHAAYGTAAAIGSMILLGWAFDSAVLKGAMPGAEAMNPVSAAAFLLAAISLALLHRAPLGSRAMRAGRVCAVAVLVVGLVRLSGVLGSPDLGIDQCLFRGKLELTVPPSRMSANSAAGFVLVGLALLLLDVRIRKGFPPAEFLGLIVVLIGMLGITGYVFEEREFYRFAGSISMPLSSAFTWVAIGVGLLCARPERGLMNMLSAAGAGGTMARRLLPPILALPLLFGWLDVLGQHARLFGAGLGLALFVVAMAVVLAGLAWWTAWSVQRTDWRRRFTEAQLEIVTREVNERIRVEQELRLNEARLESLARLNRMAEASLQEITDFTQESAVRLTQSKIGYLAFVNEDETVLTMHSWSKAAMAECAIIDKPIIYPIASIGLLGEAVRQRKPVITNDYQADSPLKKGYPQGHVHVARHMNVPIFDGDHIVMVAGVGNKEAPYDDSDVQHLTLLMQGMWQLLQRRRSQQRLAHLNAVLRAVRDVNQLICRERQRDRLLAGVCRCMVEARGYLQAWAYLRDGADGPATWAEAEVGPRWPQLVEYMRRGEVPPCIRRCLEGADIVLAREEECREAACPLCERRVDADPVAVGIGHGGQTYGALAVTLPRGMADDPEEQALLHEVAGDVGFALHGIAVEEQRKQAEEAVIAERQRLFDVLETLPVMICLLSPDYRVAFANRGFREKFGESGGKRCYEYGYGRSEPCEFCESLEVLKTGKPHHWEETFPDGRVLAAYDFPFADADGSPMILKMDLDITDQRRAEAELRKAHNELELRVEARTADLRQANAELEKAREAAEAASLAKSTFLANMSHEIRTPLNAVIGMTELVLKTELSTQQREFLATVRDSGEVLLSVINDILDFSKIEAGRLVLDREPFDLRESLGDTVKSFSLRACQQGLELACCVHPDVPHTLVGDYSRLRQIVVNLLGNAIKFTEEGEVVLEVSLESATPDHAVLHFTVSDTGIGIPLERQTAIFEMFEQGDNSTTRRHGGTGLGLAIASRLVALMDGRIWVQSVVGRGSRFHFTVRLGRAVSESPEVVAPEPPCLHGMRVLVVDDNATNRRILDEILRSWMMVPAMADNADKALELLREAQATGDPYRLVITDAHMPGTDGFVLAERIKRDAEMGSTVVMMLTSGDHPDDGSRCGDLGIGAFLLKPIKESELLEAINLALGISAARREPAAAVAHRPRRAGTLRVLLAEDSLVNQKLALALLEREGHMVTVAKNGKEALAAADAQAFDLILMDVQMPEMDGLDATARIRAKERSSGRHVPIIAMTARALKGDRERCLEAGMDGYVAKPIRASELFQAIDAHCAAAGEAAAPPLPPPASSETLNWGDALLALNGDRSLLTTIVQVALQETPQLLASIRDAIAAGDAEAARLTTHTLRGSIRYFGAGRAVQLTQQIETLAGEPNMAGAAELLPRLEEEIARLVASLAEYPHESEAAYAGSSEERVASQNSGQVPEGLLARR